MGCCFSHLSHVCTVCRFRVDGEDVKIDIFDLAGQPYFYEVIEALLLECVQGALHAFHSSLATAATITCSAKRQLLTYMLPQLELRTYVEHEQPIHFYTSYDLRTPLCNVQPGQKLC